jgi:uncharacterized protein (TIRG00374 family)
VSAEDDHPAGGGSAGKALLKLLKPLLAIALIGFVAWTLPFGDELELTSRGVTVEYPGTIQGDWKTDSIEFLLDPEAGQRSLLSPAMAEAAVRGEAFAVERGPEGEGADARIWDWRPGLPRAFRGTDPVLVLTGFLLLGVALLGGVTRWWRLLAVVGCPTSWWNTLRLTFVGLFFNLVIPGMTGGDAVKAVVVARENPGQRAVAFITVWVDRLIGLLVLLGLAGVMVLVAGDAFAAIRPFVLGLLAVAVAGSSVYASRRLRRLVRFDALLARLPFGERLKVMDDAVLLYSRHRVELLLAVLCTLWNHVIAIIGVIFLGRALGITFEQVSVSDWFVVVPVANMISAIPVTPGGWGLGEYSYKMLFEMIGGPATLGVATSVTFRLCQMGLSLLGGLFLLAPGARVKLDEIEKELEAGAEAPAT